jgi:hypothetical protein
MTECATEAEPWLRTTANISLPRKALILSSTHNGPKVAAYQGPSLVDAMDTWTEGWAGLAEDVPVGRGIVAELRPFVVHLEQRGLAPTTVRAHVNNLWVIGGEIIREVNEEPRQRKLAARKLLLKAIDLGEAPLARGVSEADQNAIDATARRLLRFMMAHGTK